MRGVDRPISATKAQALLASTFLLCLIAQLFAVFVPRVVGAISDEDLVALISKLLAVYSVHLAVIAGCVFAKTKTENSSSNTKGFPKSKTLAALTLVIVWNLLLMGRTFMFSYTTFDLARDDSTDALLGYITTVSGSGSFLVAGLITYFFSSE